MPVFEVKFQANMLVKVDAETPEQAAQWVDAYLEDSCFSAGSGFRLNDFIPNKQIRWFPQLDGATTVRQLPEGVKADEEYPLSKQDKFREMMFEVIEKANNDPEFMDKLRQETHNEKDYRDS